MPQLPLRLAVARECLHGVRQVLIGSDAIQQIADRQKNIAVPVAKREVLCIAEYVLVVPFAEIADADGRADNRHPLDGALRPVGFRRGVKHDGVHVQFRVPYDTRMTCRPAAV